MKFKSLNIVFPFLTLIFVIVGFQNCSQNYAIDLNPDALTLKQSTESTELEIIIPENPETAPATEIPPATEPTLITEIPPATEPMPASETHPSHDKDCEDSYESSHHNYCQNIRLKDLQLNIISIGFGSINIPGPGIITAQDLSLGIKISISKTMRAQQIRLILAEEENKLLTDAEEILNLKTPSAQESGLKLLFNEPLEIHAGDHFLILEIDLGKTLHSAGKKCILKPTLKSAKIK